MSLRSASEQLVHLRHDAQLLIERAGDQEGQLEALVAATDGDLRQAEAPSHMLRTTSMRVTSDTCSPDNSNEARRALQLPGASLPARTNSMPPRVDYWRI